MKLLFKQRFFSWFDSYNVYSLPDNVDADSYELSDSDVRFVVEGQLALGHCFLINDSSGRELGRLEKRLFTLLPEYDIYIGSELYGTVEREFSLFTKSFNLDVRGWSISGGQHRRDYRQGAVAPDRHLRARHSRRARRALRIDDRNRDRRRAGVAGQSASRRNIYVMRDGITYAVLGLHM